MSASELNMSVVIPTYNRPGSLSLCLDSLEKQVVPPYEVIIVSDGKPADKIHEVIDNFRNKLSIIQITNHRGGEHLSRDIGAETATGDIVAYIDDDVILVPEWSAEILRGYQENKGVAGVGGRVINMTSFPKPWVWRAYVRVIQTLFRRKMGRISFIGLPYARLYLPCDRLIEVDFLQGGNMSLRREILASHKWEGLTYFSDESDLGIQLTRKEKRKLIYNSRAIAYHYPALTGGSTRGRERMHLAVKDYTILILKNFNLKYLRLILFSIGVLVASLLTLRLQCMKAIWEGVKEYRVRYRG